MAFVFVKRPIAVGLLAAVSFAAGAGNGPDQASGVISFLTDVSADAKTSWAEMKRLIRFDAAVHKVDSYPVSDEVAGTLLNHGRIPAKLWVRVVPPSHDDGGLTVFELFFDPRTGGCPNYRDLLEALEFADQPPRPAYYEDGSAWTKGASGEFQGTTVTLLTSEKSFPCTRQVRMVFPG